MEKQLGFTLIELLISIALIMIVLSFAFAPIQYTVQKNQVNLYARRWLNALTYAKNTAITKHKTVTLCPSKDGVECIGQWQEGMLLFIEPEQKLRYYQALPKSLTIYWNRNKQRIRFSSQGMLLSQNGSLIIRSKSDPNVAKAIIISRTGRVRLESVM